MVNPRDRAGKVEEEEDTRSHPVMVFGYLANQSQ